MRFEGEEAPERRYIVVVVVVLFSKEIMNMYL